MFPSPIILNTNVLPVPPAFLLPQDVIYRQDVSGTVYRQAIEGTEYIFNDTMHTEVKFLRFNTFYNVDVPMIANKKLFLRFMFTGTYDRLVLQPWNAGALFTYGFNANTWYELKVEYGVDAGVNSRWTINNVQQYYGSKQAPVSWFFGIFGGPNSTILDIGNRGGVLPPGFEWWYNPR